MLAPLEIAVATYSPEPFKLINDVIRESGHKTVALAYSRSMRPAQPVSAASLAMIPRILESIPDGLDLLLPGRPGSLAKQLSGYQVDLMIVFGFNWIFPSAVLETPTLGILNVHPSALPLYRGPSPIPWAVRNGDPSFKYTVHRMSEQVDAGPIMAQSAAIPFPEPLSHEAIWELTAANLPGLLAEAIDRAARGDEGDPQDSDASSYAPLPTDDWYVIDWSESRERVHHQIRVLRLLQPGEGVVSEVAGRRLRVRGSSLTPQEGALPVQCGDGELYLTDWDDD